jgi:hypothetical protein
MPGNQFLEGRVAPWSLWVVGVLSLLWNGMGTFLWTGTTFMPETFLKEVPFEHREYVRSLPFWSTITWGLGVLGGTAGALLLLLRHWRAVRAFSLSLLGAITNQLVYLTNPPPPGFFNPVLTAFIIGFALLQVWFAKMMMKERGVL